MQLWLAFSWDVKLFRTVEVYPLSGIMLRPSSGKKMEESYSSETSENVYQTARNHVPKSSNVKIISTLKR
jgi:hypothetical protein